MSDVCDDGVETGSRPLGQGGIALVDGDGKGPPAGQAAALLAKVESMRRELEGMRASATTRAVIEQAKGVLVERHGVSLDDAFERLRQLSAQHNVRLVEVAATLVGIRLPDDAADLELQEPIKPPGLVATSAMSPEWSALREQPDVKAAAAGALFHAVGSSVSDGHDAARLILELAGQLGATGVVLFRVAGDGSLQLVGSEGYPGDVVSVWRRIPPEVDIPLCRSVRTGEPVFLASRTEREREFPLMKGVRLVFESSASVPVIDAGQVIGVVGMGWLQDQDFEKERRAQIEHLVRTAGPVLLRSVRQADPELEWIATVLGILFDPWLVLAPVEDEGGGVVDFEVLLAAPWLPDADDLRGRRLLELWPGLAGGGVPEQMARVMRRGGLWESEITASALGDLPGIGALTRLRVVRAGPRLVAHWRACET